MSKEIIVENLKHPDTLTDLRFKCIESETDNIIKVSYYGHKVSGSYVAADEVAPKYVEDLEYSTNREVIWIGESSDGIGHDIYFFEVYINKVINPNPYIPKGKILRVANSYFSFESEGGQDWALVYISHKSILKNEIPDNIMNIRDNVIYFGDVAIANIVEYESEEHIHYNFHKVDYNRTRFHAIYDLLVSKKELREMFFNSIKQVVDLLLRDKGITCEHSYVRSVADHSDVIDVVLSNGQHISIGPNWHIFNSDDIKSVLIDHINVHVLFTSKWPPSNREYYRSFKTQPTIGELLKGYREPYKIKCNGEEISDRNIKVQNKDKVQFMYSY